MADFNCEDINGLSISQFVFNDDGTVSGIVSTGSTTTDPQSNSTATTYKTRAATTTFIGDVEEEADIILGGGLDTGGDGIGKTFGNTTGGTLPTPVDDTINTSYVKGDGTTLSPVSETCCSALNFFWDASTNKCYWSETCEQSTNDFKITLGAKGNDGAWFQIDENETCHLEVEFNYLFQFDCDTLNECLQVETQDNSRLIDLENDINSKEEEINRLNETIVELRTQISNQELFCENESIRYNILIKEKESECESYLKNIENFRALDKSSNGREQSKSYEAQIQSYTTMYERCIAELMELQGEGKLNKLDCDNQLNVLYSSLSTYEENYVITLEELNIYKEDLQNEQSSTTTTKNGISNCLNIFSELSVSVTLDKVDTRASNKQVSYEDPTTLTTIFEEDLYNVNNIVDYLSGNCNTGLLVTGDSRCVEQLEQCIIYNLSGDCGVYSACTLNSNWLHHKFKITDSETLSRIANEKVKLGFVIKNSECDFSILIDRVEINKVCTTTDKENIYISKCPSFEIERVCDNKKSWTSEEKTQNRGFSFPSRETDYKINHHKLAINTKEVDLDISPANAIETDVWCYVSDNESILDTSTGNGTCGDIGLNLQELLTTEVNTITTIKEFNNTLRTELIDVKNRKTISSYPTIRALYDRYKNGFKSNPKSSSFDYYKMGNFVSLVGNYWVDLIEQVVPSTTIWGSTIKHSNTIFDKDKFKYKQYSLFTCQNTNNIEYPSPTSGHNTTVEVIIKDIGTPEYVGPDCLAPPEEKTICSGVTIQQINYGSEFIGSVTIIGDTNKPNPTGTTGEDPIEITECDLVINNIKLSSSEIAAAVAEPNFVGGTAPYTYNWAIPIQEGQYSDWGFENGDNTNPTAVLTGTTSRLSKGDNLCLTLNMTDVNGCTYGMSQCFPE